MASIAIAREGVAAAAGAVAEGCAFVAGAVTAGVAIVQLANKVGGSGKWRRHNKQYPSRKRAQEGAQREGHGHTPIEHNGHFHSKDAKGEKVKGSHHSW